MTLRWPRDIFHQGTLMAWGENDRESLLPQEFCHRTRAEDLVQVGIPWSMTKCQERCQTQLGIRHKYIYYIYICDGYILP